ncbi:MAG: aldehyde dehydrogenase family protein [Deltaproteobacteria bacterium]|nr:aldehyde dehydrogenase family protein [Deltaproteobacteria bacterium]
MIPERHPLVNGGDASGGALAEVKAPFDGRVVTRVHLATREHLEQALSAAVAARPRLASQSIGERRRLLGALAEGLRARADELVDAIVNEAGKPRVLARSELERAGEVVALAAAEATRFCGELVPVDGMAAAAGSTAEVRFFPAGVIAGIVPFNFPLNLGVHKLAPALAVGAPILLKPPPQAPSALLVVGDILRRAGADPAAVHVLPCDNELAEALATDERVRVLSFTGSARVGWQLKRGCAGRALLELGGNASAIVCADADLDAASARLSTGAWAYAGQVCIKTQHILVEDAVFEAFAERFCNRAHKLLAEDPASPTAFVGPVIDDNAASRIEAWVQEALAAGARALVPFRRRGRLLDPCVLTDVPATARVSCEEVFGPVTVLTSVGSFDEALGRVQASPYGLQAAIFANDLRRIRRAFHELDVGGLIVNDATTFRSDAMPYGGNRRSGLGREGLRYAMEAFTEPRVLVIRP